MRIWFDTEFIDEKEIKLIAIGMLREDGATYYAESNQVLFTDLPQWHRANIWPKLRKNNWKHPRTIAAEIKEFVGDKPEFWAYFGAYDWVVLCQLYGRMLDVPATWPHFVLDVKQEMRRLGVGKIIPQDEGESHNALSDAVWTARMYKALGLPTTWDGKFT